MLIKKGVKIKEPRKKTTKKNISKEKTKYFLKRVAVLWVEAMGGYFYFHFCCLLFHILFSSFFITFIIHS